MPQYWNSLKSLINKLVPDQNFHQIVRQLKSDELGFIPFIQFSRVNRFPSLIILPSQYEVIDVSLQKVWDRLQEQIYSTHGFRPSASSVSEMRAWLNNPLNIRLLENVSYLNLSGLQLTVLPREICNLITLENLDLSNNNLRSLPNEIGNLLRLRFLQLNNNKLSALPSEIGNLQNLTTLNLDNNMFSVLPSEIGKLQNLTTLNLDNNKFLVVPSEIFRLSNLEELHLKNNLLVAIPIELLEMKLLQLELDNNLDV